MSVKLRDAVGFLDLDDDYLYLLSWSLVLLSVFFLLWHALSLQYVYFRFPSPWDLTLAVSDIFTGETPFSPTEHYWITLQRIVIGFVFAMVVSTVVGTVMGLNKILDTYLTTPLVMAMMFPAVVWAFLAVIWWGLTTYLVPVFVIFMIVTPYISVNIWNGAKDIDVDLLEMAEAFDLPSRLRWQHIYIPHLLPYIFANTRIAFSISWRISLIAEIFGTNEGIGFVVNHYYLNARADMILAWAVPFMIVMYLIERLLRRVESRAFEWRPTIEEEQVGGQPGGA